MVLPISLLLRPSSFELFGSPEAGCNGLLIGMKCDSFAARCLPEKDERWAALTRSFIPPWYSHTFRLVFAHPLLHSFPRSNSILSHFSFLSPLSFSFFVASMSLLSSDTEIKFPACCPMLPNILLPLLNRRKECCTRRESKVQSTAHH